MKDYKYIDEPQEESPSLATGLIALVVAFGFLILLSYLPALVELVK